MIVADTNLLAYLIIPGQRTSIAETVLKIDSDWRFPILWRSEFHSVLALYLRKKIFPLEKALEFVARAEQLIRVNEYHISSSKVMQLVAESKCSAYDCEFVALAKELKAPLITSDAQVLREFPSAARTPRKFVAERSKL